MEGNAWDEALNFVEDEDDGSNLPWLDALDNIVEEEEEKEETEDDGGNLPWLDALEDFEVDEADEGEGAATPELAIAEFVGAASEQELRTSGQQTPENIEGLVLASSRTDKINKRILQVCEGLADGSVSENRHYVSTAVRAVMLDVDRNQLKRT